jgi:fatty-acid peroxygenase
MLHLLSMEEHRASPFLLRVVAVQAITDLVALLWIDFRGIGDAGESLSLRRRARSVRAMERSGESALAFVRDGYMFGTKAFRRLGTDAFRTTILGMPVVVMRGREATRFFYEGGRFDRSHTIPKSVTHLLQDEGSVQTLEGAAHRRRKELFLGLLTGAGEQRLVETFSAELERTVRGGVGAGAGSADPGIRLIDLVNVVLTRAVGEWAGLPAETTLELERTDMLARMVEHAGDVGPANWITRWQRRGTERLLQAAIENARREPGSVPSGSALAVIADYREPNPDAADRPEEPLSLETAAVELLNILRPTVAVGRFMVFAAHALHRHPEWKRRLSAGDDDLVRSFANEVRRFYPFFPVIAGRATRESTWAGHEFQPGDRAALDLYATNHDPALWTHPQRFDPDRFSGTTVDPDTLIPQGGGQYGADHRCPGEPATVLLLDEAVRWLTQRLDYSVPPQDLRISLRRFPALPESGFIISDLAVREAGRQPSQDGAPSRDGDTRT